MSRGYTINLYRTNMQADDSNLGVRLGRVCIEKDIPASEVAERLGVTRASIYNWFSGSTAPSEDSVPQIMAFLAEIE